MLSENREKKTSRAETSDGRANKASVGPDANEGLLIFILEREPALKTPRLVRSMLASISVFLVCGGKSGFMCAGEPLACVAYLCKTP